MRIDSKSPSPGGRGVGVREAFDVAVVVAFALPLLGPHKAVAVELAGKTREGDAHGCASFLTGQGCPVKKSRWRNESRPR